MIFHKWGGLSVPFNPVCFTVKWFSFIYHSSRKFYKENNIYIIVEMSNVELIILKTNPFRLFHWIEKLA